MRKLRCLFLVVLCSCANEKETKFCEKHGYDFASTTIEGTVCVKMRTSKKLIEVQGE